MSTAMVAQMQWPARTVAATGAAAREVRPSHVAARAEGELAARNVVAAARVRVATVAVVQAEASERPPGSQTGAAAREVQPSHVEARVEGEQAAARNVETAARVWAATVAVGKAVAVSQAAG